MSRCGCMNTSCGVRDLGVHQPSTPESTRQARCQLGELGERRFELLDDLGGEHTGRRQVAGVLEGLVAQPGDVEVRLVPSDQLVVGEPAEPLGLDPLAAVLRAVDVDEVGEVARSAACLVFSVKCMLVRRS